MRVAQGFLTPIYPTNSPDSHFCLFTSRLELLKPNQLAQGFLFFSKIAQAGPGVVVVILVYCLSLNAVHKTTWLLGPHGLDKNVLSLL